MHCNDRELGNLRQENFWTLFSLIGKFLFWVDDRDRSGPASAVGQKVAHFRNSKSYSATRLQILWIKIILDLMQNLINNVTMSWIKRICFMTFKLTIKDVTHAVFTVLLHFPTTNNKMSEYPKFGHKFAFYSVERPRRHFFAQMGSFQSILGLKISTSTSPHCLKVRTIF